MNVITWRVSAICFIALFAFSLTVLGEERGEENSGTDEEEKPGSDSPPEPPRNENVEVRCTAVARPPQTESREDPSGIPCNDRGRYEDIKCSGEASSEECDFTKQKHRVVGNYHTTGGLKFERHSYCSKDGKRMRDVTHRRGLRSNKNWKKNWCEYSECDVNDCRSYISYKYRSCEQTRKDRYCHQHDLLKDLHYPSVHQDQSGPTDSGECPRAPIRPKEECRTDSPRSTEQRNTCPSQEQTAYPCV